MKKMTRREFVEILEIAEVEIYKDYESILNVLAVHYFDQANKAKERGHLATERSYTESAVRICEELERRNYN